MVKLVIRDRKEKFRNPDKDCRIFMEDDTVEIVAEDERPLYTIQLKKDGSIEVSAIMVCKHNDEMLDTKITIEPKSSNSINIKRSLYKRKLHDMCIYLIYDPWNGDYDCELEKEIDCGDCEHGKEEREEERINIDI